jgi:hypothetical protein
MTASAINAFVAVRAARDPCPDAGGVTGIRLERRLRYPSTGTSSREVEDNGRITATVALMGIAQSCAWA